MMNRLRIAAVVVALSSTAASVDAQVGANLGLVNPNLASTSELRGVSGLTDAAVSAIEEGRPFLRMSDLHEVVRQHVPEAAWRGCTEACGCRST